MPSPESEALASLFDEWRVVFATNPGLEEVRRLFEDWAVLTAEPRGVDYVEVSFGHVASMWAIPKGASANHAILAVHGGGYSGGSIYSHRKMFGHIAKVTGCRLLSVDYRRAPEHVFPAALDDVVSAYLWLMEQGFPAKHIALLGDSAGGALVIGLLLEIRKRTLSQPAGAVLLSPFMDLTGSGETLVSNATKDRVFSAAIIDSVCTMYLGQTDRQDPRVSPIFADYRGLPPLYVQAGSCEALLADGQRTVAAARSAGVDAHLDVYEGMQHVFQFMSGRAPEADDAVRRIAAWLRPKLGIEK